MSVDELKLDQFSMGLLEPTQEDLEVFETYVKEHTSPFSLLGARQYGQGSVVAWADDDFQQWLDDRITFAKKKNLVIHPTPQSFIDQKNLGSCSGASATTAQMASAENHLFWGIPIKPTRLNCACAYMVARGSWGSGLNIKKMQQTLMSYGNASVSSAGEYSTTKPKTTQGLDNQKHQCWTCDLSKMEQVTRCLQAGVPVCFGSNAIPSKVTNGRVVGFKSGAHAQSLVGYDYTTGLYRYQNTWNKCYSGDTLDGWGCWMSVEDINKMSIFSKYGLPYAILGQEYEIQ